jgi:hypothetical protein
VVAIAYSVRPVAAVIFMKNSQPAACTPGHVVYNAAIIFRGTSHAGNKI